MTEASLFNTLRNLRGNVRGCVYTEALWGIPYNLYAPYVSVYMLALGLSDAQIGALTSVNMVLQIFWALMSGAITDKFGRKRTTLISDLVSWSLPCLIWAVSQNFTHFLIAAIFNSVWRVSHTSWTCLLVEDTDPDLLVDVYSWIYIANLVAAFVAPFSGLLIAAFSLVPTVRFLFLLSFVMMTAKFVIMNNMVTETQQGRVRMAETRHQPLFDILRGSGAVMREILRSRILLSVTALLVTLAISRMVRDTFWSILVTEHLGIPPEALAIYQSGRSIIMLLVFFLVMPRLRRVSVYKPMLIGFGGLVISQAILVSTPVGSHAVLTLATLVEALSMPAASAMLDKLLVLVVEPKERARIMSLLYVLMILCTSPFGWIAGEMSQANRLLPFLLSIALYLIGALLALYAGRLAPVSPAVENEPAL
ncbi:MAG: Major Facilitator Superfamily protein [Chloroflexi bacterium ADurb.Bin325]|nr:MAG: Major Facilitator Superfamily protein [Chloroflexi bacterium ADurb.Bin325]